MSTRLSAVTMRSDDTLSHVSPKFRPTTPMPPPRARPAMPTVGHEPPGTVTPAPASAAYMSTRRVPDPTRARPCPATGATPSKGVTSTTRPFPMQ